MADPLSVQCPSCLAPAEEACRSDVGTHADRQDAADLHAVEHGTCALCHQPMVYGVPLVGDEPVAWHPNENDAAVCPPLPDPRADWDSFALALQQGLAPGRPGTEHFIPTGAVLAQPLPICPECAAGKHQNCIGQALDHATDEIVGCSCTCPGVDRG